VLFHRSVAVVEERGTRLTTEHSWTPGAAASGGTRRISHRRLRTVCQEVLTHLKVPDPFDIDVFCSRLAELRGRPLHVHYVAGLARHDAMCGLYYEAADDDHLFVEADTLAKHRLAILLHEIGHMLLGHPPDAELSQSVDPDRVLGLLARGGQPRKTRKHRRHEQEAEEFALLMLRWLDRGVGGDGETRDDASASLRHLNWVMGDSGGGAGG
jgi:hypothetical protein